jgi:hypothetical protein
MKCPPHGFETWRLIQFFYNGLTQLERYMIESMNGGGFLNLTGEEAYKTLDELSDNSQRWDFSSRRSKCSTTTKKEGLYEVRDNEDIRGQLKDLMRTVSILASFCVWTKSLTCKDAVNRDSTIQSLYVRRNSSSLSAVRTIEPSRPDAHLSTVPSVRATCHPVRTLDRPASSVRTKCSFRPDPILYREVSVPDCICPDVSATCLDASQYSISF